MRDEVQDLLAELRHVCAELRPPMLDMLGLGSAVRALVDEWSAQHRVTVDLELPPDPMTCTLPEEVAVNLYRVVQEALSNVARHAAARHVKIHMTCESRRLALTIRDDGRGFDVPDDLYRLPPKGHFGLVGLAERVDLIGGQSTIESAPGQGTTLRLTWPAP
jgi:signal transduction histidine kinase